MPKRLALGHAGPARLSVQENVMTPAAGDLAALMERSAREGRIARARGVAREENPHRRHSGQIYALHGLPSLDAMQHGWWRGWDQADRDLLG